ncbi:hypothetical protein [Pseudooceanicola algae]|uniref:Sialate O-acetylesterase domain-containing protein n=1 Tax=Pseudooceanicola algae TaxID=1537215 RepID=A0A7T1FNQ0_9RHOB|nr:hypothetical protein [Pseudooceanicola algae]QPM90116.1 hypothetical protein PSAL_013500 [Pseudooceanicola algae]
MQLTKTPQEVWEGNSSLHQPLPQDATRFGEEQNLAIEAAEQGLVVQAQAVTALDNRVAAAEGEISQLQAISAAGLSPRLPAVTVSTGDIALSGEQAVSGVMTSASRVLVAGQANPAENGPYITAAGAWARATDMDEAGEFANAAIQITGGTYANQVFVCTSAINSVGTDPVSFTAFLDLASLSAAYATAAQGALAETAVQQAEVGTAAAQDADAFSSRATQEEIALKTMRATLGRMTGEGLNLNAVPQLVDINGIVIRSLRLSGGVAVDQTIVEVSLAEMRRTLGYMEGEGAISVREVDQDGYIVSLAPVDPGPTQGDAYVVDGALYVSTGTGGARLLDDSADRTWISAKVFGNSVIGTYLDQNSVPVSVRVALSDGSIWRFGGYRIWTNDGQSNAEGTANDDRSVVFPGPLEFAHRPSMLMTAAKDVWLGIATSGGASVELASDAITGVTDLVDTISAADKHGTISVSAAARAHAAAGHAALGDWVPNILAWSNAEGGEFIASMLDGAPAGEYYAANMTTVLTSIADLSISAVYDWMLMQQGESDPATPTLGVNHNLLRAQTQAKAQAILGQQTPVRMVSTQASSFYNSSAGCRSILDEALADTDGVFFCTGPSYIFPWSDYDFLHNTSVGHAMRGEMEQAAIYRIEQGLGWLPLHMVSASFTGANEVTVTLSEDAESVTGWLVDEAGLANSGIALVGATVSGVAVAGDELIITTSDAASGATAVQAAMVGHGAGPRAQATIPRSTIRAVEQTGTFLTGAPMHKPLCHQEISIG